MLKPSLELFANTDSEREQARQLQQAAELTATLNSIRGDVSSSVGFLERESPLFFGTGENPVLF